MKPTVTDGKRSIRKVNEGVPSPLGPPGGPWKVRNGFNQFPLPATCDMTTNIYENSFC